MGAGKRTRANRRDDWALVRVSCEPDSKSNAIYSHVGTKFWGFRSNTDHRLRTVYKGKQTAEEKFKNRFTTG